MWVLLDRESAGNLLGYASVSTGDQRHARRQLSKDQLKRLVLRLGDTAPVLATADPKDKGDVYRELGVQVHYHPHCRVVPYPSARVLQNAYYRTCRRTEPKLCPVAVDVGWWLVRAASGCLT